MPTKQNGWRGRRRRNSPGLGSKEPASGMDRVAQCQCGSLRITATGEPHTVAVCHCIECQSRTGSVFAANAYYEKERTRIEGPSRLHTRDGQAGRKVRFHFCPNCGTSIYWDADFFPNYYGIAVGAFADPKFPAPSISAWEQSLHHWVTLPSGVEHFERIRPATVGEE
jgi:hypothetical protein